MEPSWLQSREDADAEFASVEAYFPAAAGNWYMAWLTADGSCDDQTFMFWTSLAMAGINVHVPFVVFEQ